MWGQGSEHNLPYFLVVYHPTQTIGAKEQTVSRRKGLSIYVCVNFGFIADGAVDDVTLGMGLGFLASDLAGSYQPFHQGVVHSDLLDFVLVD